MTVSGLCTLVLCLPLCARSSAAAPDPTTGGGERLGWVDLELVGPLDGVRLQSKQQAGSPPGATVLDIQLLEGERRVLAVPVPIAPHQHPLAGASVASSLALPIASVLHAGRGSARVKAWHAPQPAREFEHLPAGLETRSPPPVANPIRHASLVGLLLLGMAFAGGLFLRARRHLAPLSGGLMAVLLLVIVAREGAPSTMTVVVEADLTRDLWLEVRCARDQLDGPFDSLEVESPDAEVEILARQNDRRGRLRLLARAPGHVLIGRRLLAGPRRNLEMRRNQLGDFRACFLRMPDGTWSTHGAWLLGDTLPRALLLGPGAAGGMPSKLGGRERESPPGWLAAGLPPGNWALLGRLADGRWVRANGFRARGESKERH